jgi:hypothetical protein
MVKFTKIFDSCLEKSLLSLIACRWSFINSSRDPVEILEVLAGITTGAGD